jgi:hypothetical protein
MTSYRWLSHRQTTPNETYRQAGAIPLGPASWTSSEPASVEFSTDDASVLFFFVFSSFRVFVILFPLESLMAAEFCQIHETRVAAPVNLCNHKQRLRFLSRGGKDDERKGFL